MTYSVVSPLQGSWRLALQKTPPTARVRMQLSWRSKTHTDCAQREMLTSKHGRLSSKHRGRWVTVCCSFGPPTLVGTTSQNCKHC